MFDGWGRYFLIALFFFPISLIASGSDSLLLELEAHPEADTGRVMLLLELANTQYGSNPVQAAKWNEEALAISKQEHFDFGQVKAHYLTAVLTMFRSECDSTNVYLDSAEALLPHPQLPGYQAKVYNLRAICREQMGDFEEAVAYYQMALKQAEELENDLLTASLHTNLGNVYKVLGNFEGAWKSHQLALPTLKNAGQEGALGSLYTNIGEVKMEMGLPDSALVYYRLSRYYKERSQKYINLSSAFHGLGLAHWKLNAPDSAEYYFDLALEWAGKYNNRSSLIETYTSYGEFLFEQGRTADAEEKIRPIFELDSTHQVPNRLIQAYQTFAKIQADKGDFALAYRYQREYLTRRDSMYSMNLAHQIAEYQERYHAEKRDLKITRLEAEESKKEATIAAQNLWVGFAMGLAVVLLIVAMVILWVYQKSKRLNTLLASKAQIISEQNDVLLERNQQLEELSREKDGLVEVVAHDLKAPLNSSMALIDLAESEDDLPPTQQQYLGMMRKVNSRGLQLISDLLRLHAAEDRGAEYTPEVRPLGPEFDSLLQGFQKEAERKGIALRAPMVPPTATACLPWEPFHRIIENLVSNAIKFSPGGTTVEVGLVEIPNELVVVVKDEGPGISEEDQAKMFQKFQKLSAQPTAGEHSTGLGLAIVKTLLEQIGGRIEVESELGQGTTFRVAVALASA